MKRIYIAGPYTNGDVANNVYNAISAADELLGLGFAPYVPHLTHFWHIMFSHKYDKWLELDNQYLVLCDGVLRLPGNSSGADSEVLLATEKNIPVFYDIDSLVNHFSKEHKHD